MDKNEIEYWNKFYLSKDGVKNCSEFCKFVID